MIFQYPLPFCTRCGCMHLRFVEKTYSAYCQKCEDQTVTEAFFNRRKALGQTESEQLEAIRVKRPELFERGVLPGYWAELKERERSSIQLKTNNRSRAARRKAAF